MNQKIVENPRGLSRQGLLKGLFFLQTSLMQNIFCTCNFVYDEKFIDLAPSAGFVSPYANLECEASFPFLWVALLACPHAIQVQVKVQIYQECELTSYSMGHLISRTQIRLQICPTYP